MEMPVNFTEPSLKRKQDFDSNKKPLDDDFVAVNETAENVKKEPKLDETRKKRFPLFITVDIEKAGCELQHPILAIGFCLASFEDGMIEKKTFCLKPEPWQTFEPRCKTEFWAHQEVLLKRIEAEALPAPLQIRNVERYLKEIEERFSSEYPMLVLLSDNPEFDLGNINHNLYLYAGRRPMRYTSETFSYKYRWVEDPCSRLQALSFYEIYRDKINNLCVHDHWPENDAENIFWQQAVAEYASMLFIENLNRKQIIEKIDDNIFRPEFSAEQRKEKLLEGIRSK